MEASKYDAASKLQRNLGSIRFYAKAIGATQIRIMYPINDKVKEHYLGLGGFSFDAKGNFCYPDL